MSVIECIDLTKKFGSKVVIDNMSIPFPIIERYFMKKALARIAAISF